MRILFSLTYFTPYVSGLTIYVERLASELAVEKHTICILCMQHNTALPTSQHIGKVSVIRAKPIASIGKGFLSLDWFRKAWKAVRDTDVVVVNLPQLEGIIPAVYGRLQGKRVIAIYHCEVLLPMSFLNRIIQTVLEFSNSLTLLVSHKVLTYTDDFAQHSRLLAPFLDKVTAVYPPIPKPIVRPKDVKKFTRKMGGDASVVIGVAARLAAEKGIEYFFEAIPLLTKRLRTTFKIVVAGPLNPVGEEDYREKIFALANTHKNTIVFLGTLSQQEMGAFYSLLDVLVLPSLNSTEAFGMVQVEAMLTGVPVVASDLPGVRIPIMKTGMGRLVHPADSASLIEAIVDVIHTAGSYSRKQSVVRKEFLFSAVIQRLVSFITSS